MHRSKLDIGGAAARAEADRFRRFRLVLARQAWARRLRRLTLLPWPSPQGLRERALARSVSRTTRQWRAARWPSSSASRKSSSVRARKRRHPVVHALFSSQRSVTARDAHSAEDWRRHALFTARSSKEPSRTERARRDARLRLDAALEAAEDGHIAGLQLRRASWRG